jgi:hypothetical protein
MWSMGRGDFTCREAAEALDIGYRVAVRGVNKLADYGLVVDVGKLRQATVWNSCIAWDEGGDDEVELLAST